MSTIVQQYRQTHSARPRKRARRWSLALTGLGAVIVCAMMLIEASALVLGGRAPAQLRWQDSTLAEPSSTVAGLPPDGDLITGSLTRLSSLPTTRPNLMSGVFIVAFGAITGLTVFFALSGFLGEGGAETPSKDAKTGHSDLAANRRWHGGPIRN